MLTSKYLFQSFLITWCASISIFFTEAADSVSFSIRSLMSCKKKLLKYYTIFKNILSKFIHKQFFKIFKDLLYIYNTL